MATTAKRAGSRSAATPKGKSGARVASAKAAPKQGSRAGAGSGAGKEKLRPPVTLNGKPAKNRHFLLDRTLFESASEQCAADGIALSDVLRFTLAEYGKGAAPARPGRPKAPRAILPEWALDDLWEVWHGSDGEPADQWRVNCYLAALHRAGWTSQAIADSLVAAGVVTAMTRQAVNLRVLKAAEMSDEDFAELNLPDVPERALRRTIVSPRRGVKGKAAPVAKGQSHDLAFRVLDEVYEVAARRAKAEGAMIAAVLDDGLRRYVAGDVSAAVIRGEGDAEG